MTGASALCLSLVGCLLKAAIPLYFVEKLAKVRLLGFLHLHAEEIQTDSWFGPRSSESHHSQESKSERRDPFIQGCFPCGLPLTELLLHGPFHADCRAKGV